MKKIIIGLLLILASPAFAQTEIARINERNSNKTLIYSQEGSSLVFTLIDGQIEKEIKRLNFNISSSSLKIEGDRDVYNFEFIKKMTDASASAYQWCWRKPIYDSGWDIDYAATRNAMKGFWFLFAPGVATMSLCAVGPGIPFIVGVLAAPIDGIFSLADRVVDPDAIAARKFSKLMTGKSKKASKAVFESLVKQISNL